VGVGWPARTQLSDLAAIRRTSSLLSNLVARLAVVAPMHKSRAVDPIGKPVIAIGDRKGLLASFANRLSGRSNVLTDDFVDGLTSRTDIKGRCDRHGGCSLRENQTRADRQLVQEQSKKAFAGLLSEK
jgi:hypothetical protein